MYSPSPQEPPPSGHPRLLIQYDTILPSIILSNGFSPPGQASARADSRAADNMCDFDVICTICTTSRNVLSFPGQASARADARAADERAQREAQLRAASAAELGRVGRQLQVHTWQHTPGVCKAMQSSEGVGAAKLGRPGRQRRAARARACARACVWVCAFECVCVSA
jgi:hypothetical protein